MITTARQVCPAQQFDVGQMVQQGRSAVGETITGCGSRRRRLWHSVAGAPARRAQGDKATHQKQAAQSVWVTIKSAWVTINSMGIHNVIFYQNEWAGQWAKYGK